MNSDTWLEYTVYVNTDFGEIPMCGLCGCTGMISKTTYSPAQCRVEMEPRPCICPNGRAIKRRLDRKSEDGKKDTPWSCKSA